MDTNAEPLVLVDPSKRKIIFRCRDKGEAIGMRVDLSAAQAVDLAGRLLGAASELYGADEILVKGIVVNVTVKKQE
jgi:hypothetical protein